MAKRITQAFTGLLIVLLSIGAFVAGAPSAAAAPGDEQDTAEKPELTPIHIPYSVYNDALDSAFRRLEGKSDTYKEAFNEALDECLAEAGGYAASDKDSRRCARVARRAARAADRAGFTEEGGLPDVLNPSGPGPVVLPGN